MSLGWNSYLWIGLVDESWEHLVCGQLSLNRMVGSRSSLCLTFYTITRRHSCGLLLPTKNTQYPVTSTLVLSTWDQRYSRSDAWLGDIYGMEGQLSNPWFHGSWSLLKLINRRAPLFTCTDADCLILTTGKDPSTVEGGLERRWKICVRMLAISGCMNDLEIGVSQYP